MLFQKIIGGAASPKISEFNYITNDFQEVSQQTSSSFTFGNVSLGSANTNRLIVVAMRLFNRVGSVGNYVSTTISGVTATTITEAQLSNSAFRIVAAFVPAGTSGNIVISTGNRTSCGIGVWRMVKNDRSLVAFDSSSAMQTSSRTLSYPNNGCTIAVGGTTDGSSLSWTNVTERYDVDIKSNEWSSGADDRFFTNFTAGTQTISFSASGASGIATAVWKS